MDQVMMSPNNGALVVAIPLYRRHHEEILGKMDGFVMSLSSGEPIAYAVDVGIENLTFMNAEWVEKNLINLGDI